MYLGYFWMPTAAKLMMKPTKQIPSFLAFILNKQYI